MRFSVAIFQNFWIIFGLLSTTTLDVASTESDTLVFLHVLFRHGNRTPDREGLFPTDPHRNETYQPFGYSQLTTKGKKTEYQIGQYLRNTYDGFISPQYTPDVVYAISTNFKRTKMSLELVLAGLFPPLESDIFYEGLNWQPIPFNVEQDEHLIGIPLIYCPNFSRQYYSYILSREGQTILNDYKELYQNLSILSGLEVTTPEQVLDLYETLESELDYGFELPEWASSVFLEILEQAATLYFDFATMTPQLRRLTNGQLLKKILEDSLAKREGLLPEEKKISLYSAHDFHVSTLLNTLNIHYSRVPPYGATLIFEIHNIDGVYGIKLYYHEPQNEQSPTLLMIPGCSSFCNLDKFVDLIADNLPGIGDVCSYNGEIF